MLRMKPPSERSLPVVLKAIAEPKSWFIFRAIASDSLESDTLIKKTKFTPKQYYSRISEITNAGLVIRKNKKHYLTSLGKIVYESQLTTQKAINNYWKLKAIDSFGDVPEKEQLIKELVDDKDLFELLTRIPYSTSSDIKSGSDSLVNTSMYAADRKTEGKSSLNLMLIEDDLDTAVTFETILKSQGYDVETFTEPFEALKHFIKLNRPYYDLIISDIRMPGMNGIQLYQKLKSIDNDVRVIFLTALDASYELLSIMPEIKKSHIIRKPVSSENFIGAIERALSLSHPVSYVS